MVYIAAWETDKICSINEISEAEKVPREYLAKILKELSLQGLLHSYKGINGGYRLAKSRDDITFLDIIESMQGKIAVNDCIRHSDESGCSKKPECAMHAFWKSEQQRVVESLGSVNLNSFDYEHYYPFARKKTGKESAVGTAGR
jgi:Rrf2 family protein